MHYRMDCSVRSTLMLILLACICSVGFPHKPCFLFTQRQAALIYQHKKPTLILLLGDYDESLPLFQTVSKLSNQYQDILFTYSKIGSQPYYKLIEFIGVHNLQAPIIMYIKQGADKFLYTNDKFGQPSRINIKMFLSKVDQNEVDLFLKSKNSTENLSQEQLEENKKFLTYYNSYTLREDIQYLEKELVVLIYGTWCVHSQRFSPEFSETARRMQPNLDIKFGKIDGNWNQIRQYQAQNYPTLIFFKQDRQSKPIVYAGKRNNNDIIAWIKENSQYPWVEPLPQRMIKLTNQNKDILTQLMDILVPDLEQQQSSQQEIDYQQDTAHDQQQKSLQDL